MNTLLNAPERKKFQHEVKMWTAGSPPPPSVIQQFQDVLGIDVQTVYGLTEVYGPVTSSIFDPEWVRVDNLSENELMNRKIVQARDILKEDIQVLDPETMERVPPDGKTLGEVMIHGNIVMKGYLRNPKATEECFENGWFHTGDLAVNHGRGRFEIKDRSKGNSLLVSTIFCQLLLTFTFS
jgi:fatty-acyl-CoA synthase